MTREVKRPEIRKNEILDAARKFFFQKGFDQTSVQDIIDELGIAKGTFYHYFTSKIDLLDKLTDRTTNEIYVSLKPIVQLDMNAIEKFNKFFQVLTAVSMQNIDVFLVTFKVMFRDENTIIRVKMYRRMVEKNTPLFSSIIEQGIKESVFNNPYPSDVAELLMQIGANLDETIGRLILHENETLEYLVKIMAQKTKLYQDAMERILGAPQGSLQVYISEDYGKFAEMFHGKLRKEKNNETDKT